MLDMWSRITLKSLGIGLFESKTGTCNCETIANPDHMVVTTAFFPPWPPRDHLQSKDHGQHNVLPSRLRSACR